MTTARSRAPPTHTPTLEHIDAGATPTTDDETLVFVLFIFFSTQRSSRQARSRSPYSPGLHGGGGGGGGDRYDERYLRPRSPDDHHRHRPLYDDRYDYASLRGYGPPPPAGLYRVRGEFLGLIFCP